MSEVHPLSSKLNEGDVTLEPLAERHIEDLRAACAQDQEIWDIYPVSMLDEHFDTAMRKFHQTDSWVQFAVVYRGKLVGMSNYINPDPDNGVVEIGGTYIAPSARGTGCNDAMKRLMIEHAFAHEYRRIEFRVDARNKRSAAAVLKLGAQHEGTLRKNRITWTGYVRDTMVFGLMQDEWQ